jgi:hypothetical protein
MRPSAACSTAARSVETAVAPLISYQEFLRFQALQEQEALARFDRLVARMAEQNAARSEEEVAADVAAARAELDA